MLQTTKLVPCSRGRSKEVTMNCSCTAEFLEMLPFSAPGGTRNFKLALSLKHVVKIQTWFLHGILGTVFQKVIKKSKMNYEIELKVY